jgi:SnoaL-like domain
VAQQENISAGPSTRSAPSDPGDDLVMRYCQASEAGDFDALRQTLAPDAELVSPLAAHAVFRGRDDVCALLQVVYGAMRELRWKEQIGNGRTRVVMGEAFVGGLRIGDAMVIELAPDGRIQRFRPHLRPWLAVTLLALKLTPLFIRRPDVIRRAFSSVDD